MYSAQTRTSQVTCDAGGCIAWLSHLSLILCLAQYMYEVILQEFFFGLFFLLFGGSTEFHILYPKKIPTSDSKKIRTFF